jgi:hypothetical protein
VSVPEPVPEPPEVMLIQLLLESALQEQVEPLAATLTLPEPPSLPTEAELGEME